MKFAVNIGLQLLTRIFSGNCVTADDKRFGPAELPFAPLIVPFNFGYIVINLGNSLKNR